MDYNTRFYNFNKKWLFFYKKLVFFFNFFEKKAVFNKVVKLPRQPFIFQILVAFCSTWQTNILSVEHISKRYSL